MSTVRNPRPMLSKKEIKNFHGKLRNLELFLRNPRAADPKIQAPLHHLYNTLHRNLLWQNFLYTRYHRQQLDHILRCTAILEDVMIQVIIQGKDFDEVIARESEKPGRVCLEIYKKTQKTQ